MRTIYHKLKGLVSRKDIDIFYIVGHNMSGDQKNKISKHFSEYDVSIKFLVRNSLVDLINRTGTNRKLLNLYSKKSESLSFGLIGEYRKYNQDLVM